MCVSVCVCSDTRSNIPFIITWGTLWPSAAMTVTLCSESNIKKEGEFQPGGFSCKRRPLGESYQSASGSVPPGNKDHIQSKQASVWFPPQNTAGRQWRDPYSECVCEKGKGRTSGCLSETQVNSKLLVSNLLICPEAKKTLTTSRS